MNKSKGYLPLLVLLLFVFSFNALAEDDPNPDSPVPVLLSQTDASRVLAVDARKMKSALPVKSDTVFTPGAASYVTLFVTNVALMDEEKVNAFRVYLYQKSRKTYELQTVELTPLSKTLYALKVRLYERDNYRGQPAADGDSLIYLTWRGLRSNALKIALGRVSNDIAAPESLKSTSLKTVDGPTDEYVGYRWSGDRVRFLEQAAFGPSTELDNRIRRIGLRTWLAEQFEEPYPTTPYPNIPLMPTTPQTGCTAIDGPFCYRERYTMQPLQQWFFKEALYGNAQLRHRVAWALSQIWVTSGVQIQQSSHMIAYHKVLANNAFGNYRDLMREVTLNPAMGDYLDMVRSTKNNPNENYPREILQLFSIGLFMLNQDGTLQRDAQNNPIPTYNQEIINNFSKVFTGWGFCQNPALCPSVTIGAVNYKDPMLLNPANHDTTAKTLLAYPDAVGTSINACTDCTNGTATAAYANASLEQALDNIFNHPNVGPFIGRLLIQHLVTSDPSPAYVERVAGVFSANRTNPAQMKEVVKAILLDPEARGNVKTAPRYGKLREPVQLVTNLARIFPARSFSGEEPSDGGLNSVMLKMGQNVFNSPTVFNYFTPEYVVPGTTLNAPEFELLNTSSAISRINFLHTFVFEGFTPNLTDALRGTSLSYAEALPLATDDPTSGQLLDFLNNKMMHGAMTAEQRASVQTAVNAVPAANPLLRVKTAVYLIAASAQYQIQR